MTDAWNPTQYERFARERSQPFFDLVALLTPVAGGRVADLGCGTGNLTAQLPGLLGAKEVVGLDNSPTMLASTPPFASEAVRFEEADIEPFHQPTAWDVIISNAALHWIPDHPAVLARWADSLRPNGQLAVQVPANADHPSHICAREAADSMAGAFQGPAPTDPVAVNVLPPERYAEMLDGLELLDVHVRLQVYGHHLPSTADVVEWTKGTSLTRFQGVLSAADYGELVRRYRARLLAIIGDHSPYFYTFKRILMAARR
ncbi:MAG: methyltransferase domain-containing protein [Thermomicrobiales bacterium]